MSRHPHASESEQSPGAHRKAASLHGAPVRDAASAVMPDMSAKATLASKVNELLDANGLSQSAAAQLLRMPQPKVSAIRNYKLRGISLERLMQALLALNQQVDIIVKPGRKSSGGSIRVAP